MDNKLLDMLNDQMNFEYESAYLYKGMAAYLADLELDGFTNRMDVQVAEELQHGEGMKSFLQSLGYKVVFKDIKAGPVDYDSVLAVMKAALDHEKEVSRRIHELVLEAQKEDNHRVYNFLQWYVDEQVEEEENFTKLITRLERVGSDRPSLYILDGQMGQRTAAPSQGPTQA